MITITIPLGLAIVFLITLLIFLTCFVLDDLLAKYMTRYYKLVEKEDTEMACKRKGCGKGKGKRK